MVRLTCRVHERNPSIVARLLELLHQAFVGHVTYYYLVSYVARVSCMADTQLLYRHWGDTTILLGRIAW